MSSPVPPKEERYVVHGPDRVSASPRFPRLFAALLAIFAGVAGDVGAGTIYWGSQGFTRQVDSRGMDWRNGFSMRLGVFQEGFTPRPGNVDDWSARWIELDTARFDLEEGRFAGVVDDSLPLPVGAGRQVYVWALNGTDLTRGPEWLLFTNPAWLWSGKPSPTEAAARTWVADEAALVILGGVSNQAIHLTSAAIRPAPVAMAAWLAGKLTGNADPDEDSDGDGLANRLEYFLGTDPASPGSLASPELRVEAAGVRVALSRNPYAVSSFVLESSSDLKSWKPSTGEILQDHPDRVEILAPRLMDGRPVFYRFQLKETPAP